jgi:hypothetical protein
MDIPVVLLYTSRHKISHEHELYKLISPALSITHDNRLGRFGSLYIYSVSSPHHEQGGHHHNGETREQS